MALFSISCTTCRARLKVREMSAIGQILACPKCGSMVQVLAPEGWQPPENGDESQGGSSSMASSFGQSSAGQASIGQAGIAQPSGTPSSGSSLSGSQSSSAAAPTGRWKDEVLSGSRSQLAGQPLSAAGAASEQAAASTSAAPTSAALLKWSLLAGLPALAVCAALGTWLWSSRLPHAEPEPLAAAPKVETPPVSPIQPTEAPTTEPAKTVPAKTEPPKPAPLALDRRFVPGGAEGLLSLRLGDLHERPAAAAVFEHLGSLWSREIGPLLAHFELAPEEIRRLTWITTSAGQSPGEHWLESGVVVVELKSDKKRPALAKGDALGWKLAGATVHAPTGDGWPHPFALAGNSIVTGPEALIKELADRDGEHLADAEFERLLDGLDFNRQAVAAVALKPLRKAGALPEWLPLVDVWQVSKDDWRVVRDSPAALGLALELSDSLEVELRLACDSETTAEQVRASLDRLLAAMEKTLAGEADGLTKKLLAGQITTADASRLKRLLAAGRQALAKRESGVQDSLVWARTPWQGDLPNLAVAVLSSVPELESSRLAAARPLDEENHRRLLLGLAGYDKAEGALPFGAADASLLPPETRLSWIATLLPYYDRLDWHGELNFSRSWNDAVNARVTRRVLDPVINPAIGVSQTKAGFPVTHYVGLAGIGADAGLLEADDPRAGAFGYRRRISAAQLPDGAANTIALMGVQDRLGAWAAGGEATVRPLANKPYINGPDGFGSGQADGMFVGMADGSARFLSKDVDPSVLEALATIRGGETPAPKGLPRLADSPPKRVMPLESPAEPQSEPENAKPRRNGGPEIDVTAHLADPLSGIQFESTPLDEAIELLSQLSAVPITFDPEALAEAGVSPDAKVSLELSETTVGAALTALVEQQRLAYVVVDGQILVTTPERREQKLETFVLNIADLTSAERSADDLRLLVERFVEPTSWQSAGGYGKIEIAGGDLRLEQTRAIADEASDFLDKLRLAAGKPTVGKQSTGKSAKGVVSLVTRFAAAKARLAAPVTANYRTAAPLAEIVEHLGKAAHAEILFDGLALSAAGASPATEAELTVAKVPLADALAKLLEPLSLGYRLAGAGQIVITTPEALGERLEVEFYPVAKLIGEKQTAAALIERIKKELDPRIWDDAGGAGLVEYEPAGCLIVLQTQPRQIELEQLLDAWQGEGKLRE